MTKLANTIKSFSESFPLTSLFSISRGTKTTADVVRVEVNDGMHTGQGECVPYARYGESLESVRQQIDQLDQNINRAELQQALPAGAARNAIDCALWDLEAKQTQTPVWQLAGLSKPKSVTTAYTISLDTPEAMLETAKNECHRPLLKIKLGTPNDIDRLIAVRQGAPNSRIIVDANEGWSPHDLKSISPELTSLGVELIEQPLPESDQSPRG